MFMMPMPPTISARTRCCGAVQTPECVLHHASQFLDAAGVGACSQISSTRCPSSIATVRPVSVDKGASTD